MSPQRHVDCFCSRREQLKLQKYFRKLYGIGFGITKNVGRSVSTICTLERDSQSGKEAANMNPTESWTQSLGFAAVGGPCIAVGGGGIFVPSSRLATDSIANVPWLWILLRGGGSA